MPLVTLIKLDHTYQQMPAAVASENLTASILLALQMARWQQRQGHGSQRAGLQALCAAATQYVHARLKGTVPSQAMSTPSKRMMMSSGRTSLETGEVGQMLRTRTPFRGGTSPYASRRPALSMRCHFTPSTGNPVKRPLRLHVTGH